MVTLPRQHRTPQVPGDSPVEKLATSWWINKQAFDRIKKDQDGTTAAPGLRLQLLELVRNLGRKDPSGHRVLGFKESLGGLYGLKAQRAVTASWEEFTALSILNTKPPEVLKACTGTRYELDYEQLPLIIDTLRKAGVLDKCLADLPRDYIDPDLVLRYHQLHKDVITEAEIDEMMPDVETWSLIALKEPVTEMGDVD